ncbi:P-loop NTPase fold protein [Alphaproteobacteria bacterium]|nr:P-loop NTPase fold protein [Alphaproteobacteria bacterium]
MAVIKGQKEPIKFAQMEAKSWIKNWLELKDKQAVLLAGAWGTGKTTFIKNLEDGVALSNKIVHISLYGISSVEELERKLTLRCLSIKGKFHYFVQQYADQIANEKVKLNVGDIFNLISNRGKKILDINETFEKSFSNTLFVLDDLDRCLPQQIEPLLGKINDFCENFGAKIIVVGEPTNMKQISNDLIEKVFSHRIEIELDYRCVLSDVCDNEGIDLSIKEVLVGTLLRSGEMNLRKIRRCVSAIKLMINRLSDLNDIENTHYNFLIPEAVLVYLELAKMTSFTMEENDESVSMSPEAHKLGDDFYAQRYRVAVSKENDRRDRISTFFDDPNYRMQLNDQSYIDILSLSDPNIDEWVNYFKLQCSFHSHANMTDWMFVYRHSGMDGRDAHHADRMDSIIFHCSNDLLYSDCSDVGEIFHFYHMAKLLKLGELLEVSTSQIDQTFINRINGLIDEMTIDDLDAFNNSDFSEWKGASYYFGGSSSHFELVDSIRKKMNNRIEQINKLEFPVYFFGKFGRDDASDFVGEFAVYNRSSSSQRYLDEEILNRLDAKRFANVVSDTSAEFVSKFIQMIARRYEQDRFDLELKWWGEVSGHLLDLSATLDGLRKLQLVTLSKRIAMLSEHGHVRFGIDDKVV